MNYTFLLWVAIILASTKAVGLLVRRIGLPEVVGYLIAGILIGPSGLHLIGMSGDNGVFLEFTSEFGVIFLMFEAGLTTDIEEMKKNLLASFVVAVLGVIVPLVCGMMTFSWYFHRDLSDYLTMVDCLFVGVVLTATSVSITVQTLKELGHLNGSVGTTILGAAVIDDILGIVVLTVVSSMKDSSEGMSGVLIKIILYMVMIGAFLFVAGYAKPLLEDYSGLRRSAIFAFAFAFLLSFLSEELFGITDITGAYFAGLMLAQTGISPYIDIKVSNVINMFFGAIFFACIGIKVTLGGMDISHWIFAILLVVVAILTKVAGCGLGAFVNHFNVKQSLQIGVGMVSRGEVALIVAEKGRQLGLVSPDLFAPIILVVIATTLITPIALKLVFAGEQGAGTAA